LTCRAGRARGRALPLVVALGVLAPPPVGAQTSPTTLGRVDSLVAEGMTEQARVTLLAWWDGAASSAGRLDTQYALWLRGLLTVDPVQAGLDYQRLVLEYPGGPYSDRALLRLAQAAKAQGDHERARDHLRVLLRDYQASPHRLEAGRLLGSMEPIAPPHAPVSVTALHAPGPAATGPWTVQVGAFASPGRARDLRDRLMADRIEARLVQIPGTSLIRVRTGWFPSQEEAEALTRRLRAQDLDAAVASDAHREQDVP